jgi:2-oxoglutarate dehydrogenase E1 component
MRAAFEGEFRLLDQRDIQEGAQPIESSERRQRTGLAVGEQRRQLPFSGQGELRSSRQRPQLIEVDVRRGRDDGKTAPVAIPHHDDLGEPPARDSARRRALLRRVDLRMGDHFEPGFPAPQHVSEFVVHGRPLVHRTAKMTTARGVEREYQRLYAGFEGMAWLDDVARASPEYVESLYRDFQRDPASVDERWALVFAGYDLGRKAAPSRQTTDGTILDLVRDVIHAYRELGHLVADLDPLGQSPRHHPLLTLEELGVGPDDLDRVVDWAPFRSGGRGTLRELVATLAETYADALGVEYMEISDKERRVWLQARMEPRRNRPDLDADDRRRIFEQLLAAEMFEQFLQARYPGQQRFSLEGGESLIPLLDALAEEAARRGVAEMVIGIPHRGRLNVLAHVLGKPYEMIFAEFEGAALPEDVQGDGDVKYHLGYSHNRPTRRGREIHLSLSPNPSHLEAVNPVVEGIVRAKQGYLGDVERRRVVPVLLHGDAAFTGQGIVYETLALSTLPSFTTGGTVHVIVDNQIGFTTLPPDYLFTRYPSDPGHVLHAPVFHVNADDPEAAVQAARLAVGHRQQFRRDVFIHFVCYRRHGHNELDDPTLTQPLMYERIRNHPTVVERYQKRLAERGELDEMAMRRVREARRQVLDAALQTARRDKPRQQVLALGGVWNGLDWAGDDWSADTRVDRARLLAVADAMSHLPDGFTPHPRVKKLLDERRERVQRGERIDWATAELLAFGSLLLERVPVRLSGQDSVRGTFTQRHAAVFDAKDGREYVPLNHLAADQAEFEAVNSPLSEAGVLGFEYGMSSADPRRLVVWEAQFGDFINSAQVVIDQFVASAESKWQRMSGLVLLLPHGYEGQGAEHSSARVERFLQLAAEGNIQVVNATTPAQIFHALRRQMRRRFRKPLIVMSPKSLLRHPKAVSALDELASGTFRLVLDDAAVREPASVRRVLLCSGKVFYALDAARGDERGDGVAIVRVEQLYPFPAGEIERVIQRYPETAAVAWAQEEPANQGSWRFVQPLINEILGPSRNLAYVGRDEAASPATGSYQIHQEEEAAILERALGDSVAVERAADERRRAKGQTSA